MELGKQITNEDLVKAMNDIRENQNENTQSAYLDALLRAQFLVPAVFDPKPVKDADGKLKVGEKVKVSFRIITNKEGHHYMPCFTDDVEFDKNTSEEPVERVLLRYREIADIILKSNGSIEGMVINPHGQGLILVADFLDKLGKAQEAATSKQTIPANTKVKLRTPKYPPVDMQEKASEYFKTRPEVRAAYLQIIEKDDGDEEYLIVVDAVGDTQGMFAEVIPLIKEYAFGMKVGMTPGSNGLGAQVMKMVKPFYEREA